MTSAEKHHLAAHPVTLNGHPATITGTQEPFAYVRTLAPCGKHHLAAQWSWPAVARIVAQGGRFTL